MNIIPEPVIFEFPDRRSKTITERSIVKCFEKGVFDVDILTLDEKIPAHRFVLSMYSEYFEEKFAEMPAAALIEIPREF